MTDALRWEMGGWFPFLLFSWIIRPPMSDADKTASKQSCSKHSWNWWLLRLEEFLALGFGIGILAADIMIQYNIMAWDGASDPMLPLIGWAFGLGVSSLTVIASYVAPESRAQSVRNWGISFFIVFIVVEGIMSQRDQAMSLWKADTLETFGVVLAVFVGVVVLVKVSEYLPADPATSYMLPLNFVLLVAGADQFPFPNSAWFVWPVVVGGTIMLIIRIVFFSALLKRCRGEKDTGCCGESRKAFSSSFRKAQRNEIEKRLKEVEMRGYQPPTQQKQPASLIGWMHQQAEGPPLTNPLIGMQTGVYS